MARPRLKLFHVERVECCSAEVIRLRTEPWAPRITLSGETCARSRRAPEGSRVTMSPCDTSRGHDEVALFYEVHAGELSADQRARVLAGDRHDDGSARHVRQRFGRQHRRARDTLADASRMQLDDRARLLAVKREG